MVEFRTPKGALAPRFVRSSIFDVGSSMFSLPQAQSRPATPGFCKRGTPVVVLHHQPNVDSVCPTDIAAMTKDIRWNPVRNRSQPHRYCSRLKKCEKVGIELLFARVTQAMRTAGINLQRGIRNEFHREHR